MKSENVLQKTKSTATQVVIMGPERRTGPFSTTTSGARASTSYSTASSSYPTGSTTRPTTNGTVPVRSRGRPRTAASTAYGDQQIICAVSESRGVSPTVGLAFINISTTEAVLCQISDNQTYTRTELKLQIYQPSEILFASSSVQSNSKLHLIVESNLKMRIHTLDRKYWAETTGMEYIQRLAIREDLEAVKVCLEANYYATCCFSAVSED